MDAAADSTTLPCTLKNSGASAAIVELPAGPVTAEGHGWMSESSPQIRGDAPSPCVQVLSLLTLLSVTDGGRGRVLPEAGLCVGASSQPQAICYC